jgi:hypothetical protein
MPDCGDSQRRRLVLNLAYQGAIQGAQSLLERAVHENEGELIANAQGMLKKALQVNAYQNDAVADHGVHVTVEDAVFKAGGKITQLPSIQAQYSRAGKPCTLEMCPSCFFNPVCQMEETEQLTAKSKQLIQQIHDLDAAARENTAWRQKLESIKQQPILNAAEELQRQREEDQFQREKDEFWKRYPRMAF